MHTIEALNVHEAAQQGIEYLLHSGLEEQSRNGPVLVAPGPVTTTYLNPREHILLSPTRDANPWLHIFDALWILDGGSDSAFLAYFAKNMADYSDDGVSSWGGYGHRLRNFFGHDQLEEIIAELKVNPTSRRCAFTMWNAWPMAGDYDQNRHMNRDNPNLHDHDFHVAVSGGRDVPCNIGGVVDARGERLNLTIFNRSNDIIWGTYGANVVQFSLLLEYIAMRVGLPIGVYIQVSHNFHAYLEKASRVYLRNVADDCAELFDGEPLPLPGTALEAGFDEDLRVFMSWARHVIRVGKGVDEPGPQFKTAFMQTVARPMFIAWTARKQKVHASNVDYWINVIQAPDWQRACREWVERRKK